VKNIKLILLFFIILFFLLNTHAYSLEKPTHQAINIRVAENTINGFSLNDYLKKRIGFTSGVQELLYGYSEVDKKYGDYEVWYWMGEGGIGALDQVDQVRPGDSRRDERGHNLDGEILKAQLGPGAQAFAVDGRDGFRQQQSAVGAQAHHDRLGESDRLYPASGADISHSFLSVGAREHEPQGETGSDSNAIRAHPSAALGGLTVAYNPRILTDAALFWQIPPIVIPAAGSMVAITGVDNAATPPTKWPAAAGTGRYRRATYQQFFLMRRAICRTKAGHAAPRKA